MGVAASCMHGSSQDMGSPPPHTQGPHAQVARKISCSSRLDLKLNRVISSRYPCGGGRSPWQKPLSRGPSGTVGSLNSHHRRTLELERAVFTPDQNANHLLEPASGPRHWPGSVQWNREPGLLVTSRMCQVMSRPSFALLVRKPKPEAGVRVGDP